MALPWAFTSDRPLSRCAVEFRPVENLEPHAIRSARRNALAKFRCGVHDLRPDCKAAPRLVGEYLVFDAADTHADAAGPRLVGVVSIDDFAFEDHLPLDGEPQVLRLRLRELAQGDRWKHAR